MEVKLSKQQKVTVKGSEDIYLNHTPNSPYSWTHKNDAVHIAYATVYGLDYLLTWNCKYIENAHMRKAIMTRIMRMGCEIPIICTPE